MRVHSSLWQCQACEMRGAEAPTEYNMAYV